MWKSYGEIDKGSAHVSWDREETSHTKDEPEYLPYLSVTNFPVKAG
jgi:hypothetical protein